MTRRQRGVTMIGWIFLLIPVALVLYGGIVAGPKYLNYYKVVEAMKKTASQLKSDDTLTAQTIRFALDKQFDTGYIDSPTVDDIGVKKGENGWEMNANYEQEAHMFGNLDLLMKFDKTVVITKTGVPN
jgi:predicted AlkP superfamily pyrophosphatase or phosphodiesterase